MTLVETGKLLTIISSFDNRRLEESTATAWKMMLDREVPDAELDDAQEIVFQWFAKENPYFEVRHLIEGLKKRMRVNRLDTEADVRSAKARGLIDKTWPEMIPLPWDIRKKLAKIRAEENAVSNNFLESKLEGMGYSPAEMHPSVREKLGLSNVRSIS